MSTDSSFSLRLHSLYYNLGCILHQQGKLAAAADSYSQALALKPMPAATASQRRLTIGPEPHGQRVKRSHSQRHVNSIDYAKIYNNLACLFVQQGRWQEAIQTYQQAIALQPNQAALYNNLGRVLFRQDPVQAIGAYRRAIELQPDFVLAHHNLGLTLQYQGQHRAAIDCFQRTLQLNPTHLSAHSDCAISWLALGEIDLMLDSLRQAIWFDADKLESYCDGVEQVTDTDDELLLAKKSCGRFLQTLLQQTESIGWEPARDYLTQTYCHWANVLTTYGGSEQLRRAEIYYQRALQLQPKNVLIALGLADCLVQQERYNAAILVCHAALAICPDAAPIYQKVGYVLEQQQHYSAAITYYQKALNLPSQSKLPLKPPSKLPLNKAVKIAESTVGLAAVAESVPHAVSKSYYASTWDWMVAHDLTDNYVALSLNAFGKRADAAIQQLAMQQDDHAIDSAVGLANTSSANANSANANSANANSGNGDSCAGLNCRRCLQQIWDQFNPIHLGDGLYICNGNPVSIDTFPLFVAKLPYGQAWVVPQQNAWMVCNAIAVLTSNQYLLADLCRAYPGQLPGCDHPDSNLHRIYTQPSLTSLQNIEGRVAVLSSLSGNTYFHWMVDVLPRIELLRFSGIDLAEIDWFLINGGHHSFQRQTLAQLGIPVEKVLSSDRHPHIQATELIVPSFAGHFGWLDEWALSFLRRSFLLPMLNGGPPNPGKFPERIYISRSQANHRQLLNEAAVLEQLRPLGFVPVQLESLSFSEQVALFAHAKAIIAPHGSGLTNIIFCRPETIVVELVSPHYIRHYYWVISRLLGLQHYFLVGDDLTCAPVRELMYQNPLIEDIWVNLDSLKTTLDRLQLNDLTLAS
nr:MAG: DUF563 domain-containing protein [Leptolyngbya sp. IPPAS B-1204]